MAWSSRTSSSGSWAISSADVIGKRAWSSRSSRAAVPELPVIEGGVPHRGRAAPDRRPTRRAPGPGPSRPCPCSARGRRRDPGRDGGRSRTTGRSRRRGRGRSRAAGREPRAPRSPRCRHASPLAEEGGASRRRPACWRRHRAEDRRARRARGPAPGRPRSGCQSRYRRAPRSCGAGTIPSFRAKLTSPGSSPALRSVCHGTHESVGFSA